MKLCVEPDGIRTLSCFSVFSNPAATALSSGLVRVHSVLCFRKMIRNPISNTGWERQLEWFKVSSQYRTLETIEGEPMEFEKNIFPGFTTLHLVEEVQKFMNKMCDPEQFQGRTIIMSMFNDIIRRIKENEKECTTCVICKEYFQHNTLSFLGPGSENKWHSTHDSKPQKEWDRVTESMMIKFGESGYPVFRATSHCLEERSKAKEVDNLCTLLCRWGYN